MEKVERNAEEYEYKRNFINTPWDDRTKNSKIGVVVLLTSIFVAIMVIMITNFAIHYRRYNDHKTMDSAEIKCRLVKMDGYPFVARIYSVTSQELLCVGAVVSKTSVVANEVCTKSGPIRLLLGSLSNPRCKKGFSVDAIEPVYHEGISNKLVILSSNENLIECAKMIPIGRKLDWKLRAYIIGRPLQDRKSYTRQQVSLAGQGNCTLSSNMMKRLEQKNLICVKDLAPCPVRAGDLLIQNDSLLGVATISVYFSERNTYAYFTDLGTVYQELKDFDINIDGER